MTAELRQVDAADVSTHCIKKWLVSARLVAAAESWHWTQKTILNTNFRVWRKRDTTIYDICVLCPSVHWLQRILDVCQAYAESHGIVLNCNKTVCMTFKAKRAKSTATPVLTLGSQYVKSVDQYKYLGIVLDTELSDDKDIQRQLRYQYCAASLFFPLFKCS